MNLQFGDYVMIEQFRHGAPNEMYLHKVVGTLQANMYKPVPVKYGEQMVNAGELVDVVNVICCGVDETTVYRVRVEDCKKVRLPKSLAYRLDQVELKEAKARMLLEQVKDYAASYADLNPTYAQIVKMIKEGEDSAI